MPDFEAARQRMVERQLARRGIGDPVVLDAFRTVPRELFVAEADAAFAYDDAPVPIGAAQTISQPYVVALMIAAAGVAPRMHVLEVGAGSGYAAAIMGCFGVHVVAVERHEKLARQAAARIDALGYGNVRIVHADGRSGFAEAAPYDAIIVSAAATVVPEALVKQFRAGGRLVIPLGGQKDVQRLVRLTQGEDGLREEQLGPVRFVPLLGGTTREESDERRGDP